MAAAAIGRALGHPTGSIVNAAKRCGIELPSTNKLSRRDITRILKRHKAGVTQKALAEEYDVTQATLGYHLRRNGVPPAFRKMKDRSKDADLWSGAKALATAHDVTIGQLISRLETMRGEGRD